MLSNIDIAKFSILSTLDRATQLALRRAASLKIVPAGKIVFKEGDPAEGLYLLVSGKIGLYKTLQGKNEIHLHTIVANEIFGEISLINKTPHNNFARAETAAKYLFVPKKAFEKTVKKDANTALLLSVAISRKLSELRHRIVDKENKTTIAVFYNEGDQKDKAWLALETAVYLEDIHNKPETIISPELKQKKNVLLIDMTTNPQTLEGIIKQKFDYDFIIINLPHKKDAVSASIICQANYLVNLSDKKIDFYKNLVNHQLHIVDIDLKQERKLDRLDWTIGHLARVISKSTIGLALGSGTVGGLAHVGVLKYFQEKKIPIDMIAGCSGGALYGSIYAYKKNAFFIEKIVGKETKKSFATYLSFAWSKKGFSDGKNIKKMFITTFGQNQKIEELKIPLAITTTDISTQKEKIFDSGDLWTAIHASIAIPIIFQPVIIDNKLYSDGNIINPLPVETLTKNGIKKTIAVYATQKKSSIKINNALDVYFISRSITNDSKALESAKSANIFINPDVSEIDTFDYKKFKLLVKKGYKATKQIFNKLQ